MSKIKQTTLADIALELDLSQVAVSKALRDHPDISADTKELVKRTAIKLGYVPNYMARNLSSKRSQTIGLVVPKVAHHFFAEIIESIYDRAYANGYEVIMTVSQENAENELKHIQTLLAMRVDGLLISVTEQTRDLKIFEMIKKRGVPLVFFDRVFDHLGFSCVSTDDELGAYEAITYLVKAGFRNIAHLGGYTSTNIGKYRMDGYLKAIKKNKLTIPSEWIIEGGFDEVSGYRGFQKLFKSERLPEVIFAVTYPVALGVLTAANELGINIPDDIDMICFGGSNYNRFIKPSLSFIQQPVQEIGKQAVDLLIEEINNSHQKVSNIKIPTKIKICDTCHQKP